MSYYELYCKYKTKYANLKKQIGGMEYRIGVQEPWFSFIKSRKKTVEGRKNRSIFAKLKVGDIVSWTNKGDEVKTQIERVTVYNGEDPLEAYIVNEGLRNTLPNKKTLEDGKAVYLAFWSEELIKETGMVAIQIKVVD